MLTAWLVVAACLVAGVAVGLFVGRAFGRYAKRVEVSADARADRVHRLRRANVVGVFVSLPVAIMIAAAPWVYLLIASAGNVLARFGIAVIVVTGLVSLVCYFLPITMLSRSIRPAYARLRGIPRRPAGRGRVVALSACFGLLFPVIWVCALLLVPDKAPWSFIAWIVALLLSVFLANGIMVPLWLVALRARELPEPHRDALAALTERMGVRLRGIRSFAGREEKVANALQIGMLPGLRYILVSDYLLEQATALEIEAIVAHELAHIRGRHVLVKVGTVVAPLVVLVGGAVLLDTVSHNASSGALVLAVLVGLLVGSMLLRRVVSIRLEQRADRTAAREVGAAHLADALGRLADLNDMRRRTGFAWALLTRHPGMQQRIEELRGGAGYDEPEQTPDE